MRYRKISAAVEARQLTSATATAIAQWCGGRVDRYVKPSDVDDEYVTVTIPTLDGLVLAQPKDWIIKGVNGVFYPCKDDLFKKMYESIPDYEAYLEKGVETPNDVKSRWE